MNIMDLKTYDETLSNIVKSNKENAFRAAVALHYLGTDDNYKALSEEKSLIEFAMNRYNISRRTFFNWRKLIDVCAKDENGNFIPEPRPEYEGLSLNQLYAKLYGKNACSDDNTSHDNDSATTCPNNTSSGSGYCGLIYLKSDYGQDIIREDGKKYMLPLEFKDGKLQVIGKPVIYDDVPASEPVTDDGSSAEQDSQNDVA